MTDHTGLRGTRGRRYNDVRKPSTGRFVSIDCAADLAETTAGRLDLAIDGRERSDRIRSENGFVREQNHRPPLMSHDGVASGVVVFERLRRRRGLLRGKNSRRVFRTDAPSDESYDGTHSVVFDPKRFCALNSLNSNNVARDFLVKTCRRWRRRVCRRRVRRRKVPDA